METFSNFIVKHKKSIIIFYAILVVLSIIGNNFVNINYGLSSYLPEELNSIKGKNILEDEFDIKGTGYVLIENKDLNKISDYAKDIKNVAGVKDVVWLGTVEDILKPVDFMDDATKKEFLSEDFNLIQVFFHHADDAESTVQAVGEIKDIVGNDGYIGGQTAVSYDMRQITSKELLIYSLVAFIIISIILFISLESFVEPILFFVTIGVAIILNMGSNALFSEVSYMTHSIVAILQLAVSMDYSIFLLHRYMDEKLNYSTKEEAMVKAVKETFSTILASALTTAGGFLALVWMKYGIGKDMGIVFAKGVIFSLIAVITLLPVLILLFDSQIEKYKHKIYFPSFKKIGPFAIKRRYVLLIIAILITVPVFLAQNNVDYYYSDEETLPNSADSVIANKKVNDIFQNKNQLALILPRGGKLKEVNLIEELEALDGVKSVTSIYSMVDIAMPEEFLPAELKDNFITEDYSMINMVLNRPMEGDSTNLALDNIKEVVSSKYDEYYLTGEAPVYSDLEKVTSNDFTKVTIISVLTISVILLLVFKSLTLPLILVFIIQLGIWVNLAIPYMLGNQLNFIAFIIIGAIQLGATVDYAILYTSRYKENLYNMTKKDAAIKTITDTGPSILTSALILFTGTLSISLITSIKHTAELTMLIGRGAMISLVLVLGLLPSFLIIFDKLIAVTTIDWPKQANKGRL